MSFPINNSGKNGGIIKGKNISQLLHQLTEGYQNVTNFDSLQFFACIATDMVRNQKRGHSLLANFQRQCVQVWLFPLFFHRYIQDKSFN